MPEKKHLEAVLRKLPSSRIFVLGDLMWDEYVRGSVARISPEAPVPVLLAQAEDRTPGGAANVLKNLRDLHCTMGILGIVGADANGMQLQHELEKWGIGDNLHLIHLTDRPTTIKTRFMARNQQLLRVDRENASTIDAKIEDTILKVLERLIGGFNALIISDYDKGLLTKRVITEAIRIAKAKNVFVAVDPQVKHFKDYVGADIMTPNEKEASEGIGESFPQNETEVEAIAKKIRSELKLGHLLITRSQRGMAYFNDSQSVYLPTVAREVFDVTGAGDTVISVYTAAVAAGATNSEAMILSNTAGGIVVGKLGTATASVDEIRAALNHTLPELRVVQY
ncbi:MAG TPA: D-glycero-beta-D-manno-heptose-7-phosphate kinase [Turneriella sp.]|nr:D-glycero-beta-D-manno-heptose-7-phosphate kinase [Turneriella sp.]